MKHSYLRCVILVLVTLEAAVNGAGQPSSFSRPSLTPFNSDDDYSSSHNENLKNPNVASNVNSYKEIQQQQGQSSQKLQIQPKVSFKSGSVVDRDYKYNYNTQESEALRQNSEPEIDSSNSQAHYNGGGYSGGTNYGWTATNSGYNGGTIICTVCSYYDAVNAQRCCGHGFRQCCNVGTYPTPTGYNSWSSPNYPSGGGYTGYSSFGQEKPGSCYYTNTGYTGGGSRTLFNQNAGYYYTRRSDDTQDVHLVKRDAPLSGKGSNYQAYGIPYSNGGYSGGGYSGGGYSGGGYSGGGSGYNGDGYSGGGFSSGGWGPSSGGGGGGHHHHGGNGIPPSTYRPPIYSESCRRDYDCPGIQKCCSAICSNPTITVG